MKTKLIYGDTGVIGSQPDSCPTRNCQSKGEFKEQYSTKINGTYYIMRQYKCPHCKNNYSSPIKSFNKKQWNEMKESDEARKRVISVTK